MPSIACSTPATLHTATALPSPASKCVAEPGGSSFSEPTFTNPMFSFLYHEGRDNPALRRYDGRALAAQLGPWFHLLKSVPELHRTPWGAPQSFQYSLFEHV